MKLHHYIARYFSPSVLHRQLYPPPSVQFHIRRYEERDRAVLVDIHDTLAPDRFPAGHRPTFEKFLDSHPVSLFVADSAEHGVIGCGGVIKINDHVHTLCYGLIGPRFHGRGVGSAMTLARLAFATRSVGTHYSLIFAVPKSISFYQRFGYAGGASWKGEDQKDYPIAALTYPSGRMESVGRILQKRGLLIDQGQPITPDENKIAVIRDIGDGRVTLELQNRAQPDSTSNDSMTPVFQSQSAVRRG